MPGLKQYARSRRTGALVAVVLTALCGAAAFHAARVLAPPELTAGDAAPASTPRGYVDTYALGAGPARPLPPDGRIAAPPGAALGLRGWTAVSLAPPVLATEIAATIAGRRVPARLRPLPRPDVARSFGDPALAGSGYLLTLRAPVAPGDYPLRVLAAARAGAPSYPVGVPLTLVVR